MIVVMMFLSLYGVSRLITGSSAMLAMWPALEALHAPVQWWQSAELWFTKQDLLHKKYLAFREKIPAASCPDSRSK